MSELFPGSLILRKAIKLEGAIAREIGIPCRFVRWHDQSKGEIVVEYRRIGVSWPYADSHPEGTQEVLRPEEYDNG